MDTGGRVILGLRLPSRSLQGCRTSKCWQIVLQALYQVCEQHLSLVELEGCRRLAAVLVLFRHLPEHPGPALKQGGENPMDDASGKGNGNCQHC